MKNIFAKNRWKNLHKYPGPALIWEGGQVYFSSFYLQFLYPGAQAKNSNLTQMKYFCLQKYFGLG